MFLGKAQLLNGRPEFFLIDCSRIRGKKVQVDVMLTGPDGGRVVLWEAGFVGS
jgi:hypothetical protein